MAPAPRFTIVTPSYNKAPFIAETLESVLTQAGDFELEYFVIDGGSTDGSIDIIRDYADRVAAGRLPAQCARVTFDWISRPDHGQSDAINQGLRRATGDIVAFINADDTYLPGALQAVAQAFAVDPDADIIYGDGDVVDATGHVQWEWRGRRYSQRLMTTYYFLWNSFTNFVMQQATFWRRRVHDAIGLLDESLHFVMDAEYWIRASAAGLSLVHLPRKLARFRLIEGTKSMSSPTVFWEDYLEIFRRYRGAPRMAPFLGFYYFNLARQRNLDPDRALADGRAALERWKDLGPVERATLEKQSRDGFALACVLVARDLLYAGRLADASRTFQRARALRWRPMTYLAAAHYVVSLALGRSGRQILDRGSRWLVNAYKRGRYDCRHDQPAS